MQPATRKVLLDLGYVVEERRSADRYECALSCDGERWVGIDTTPEAAFDAAVTSALPSRIARYFANLARDRLPPSANAPTSPTTRDDIESSRDERPPLHEAARVDAPVAKTEPVAARPSTPGPTPSEALSTLRALEREIGEQRTELGICAPRRQRLVLTRWIATARSIEELHSDDDSIHDRVRAIAGLCTRLSKRWWPGTVRALGLSATPTMAVKDFAPRDAHDVCDWAAVASSAASELSRTERDELVSRDEYGWADAIDCDPPPTDPIDTFARIVDEMESCTGPLVADPSDEQRPFPDQLVHWVRTLRWIRPHISDADRWSAAMGRCRWIAGRSKEFVDAEHVLDPAYRPEGSWASILAPRSSRTASEPAASPLPPLPGDPATDPVALSAWIAKVLADPKTDQDEIAEALQPWIDAVLALDSDVLATGNRAVRRRVSKLKRRLADPAAEDRRGRDVPPHATSHAHSRLAPDPIRTAVHSRVRGKSALVVTNRDDAQLASQLSDELGFASVDVRSNEPRRLSAAVDAIATRRFDFVLGVTGFVGHSTDGTLKAACDRAMVPYVRVAKGRPAACLRALARDLGLYDVVIASS